MGMYNYTMKWPPHITVATVVQKENKFLMVEERENSALVINQPAGHLEPGESVFDAAIRETLEETGWHVELSSIVGVYHYYATANNVTYLRLCFAAKTISQSGNPLDPDIVDTHWLSLNEVRKRPVRSPLVEQCINDYLCGEKIPLSFLKHL